MTDQSTSHSAVAQRYARALFDLAKESDKIDELDSQCGLIRKALSESDEFRQFIHSPLFSRSQQATALEGILKHLKISGIALNFVHVCVENGRVAQIGDILDAFSQKAAEERGEVVAYVSVAKALTAAQEKKLAAELKKARGAAVKLHITEEESLIGGLTVRIGSQMVDASLRTQLDMLTHAMKEVS